MLTVEQKIEHLRKLGLDSDMTEIEKMYRGKEFNIHDDAYKKLLELSQKYCIRFTQLSGLIAKAKTQEEVFGTNNNLSSNDTAKLGKIDVGRDTWIGANVNFDDNTHVGERMAMKQK